MRHRDAVSAAGHVLRGKGLELEVVGLDHDTLSSGGAVLTNEDAVGGVALPVHLLEVFGAHDPSFIDEKRSREGNAVELVAFGDVVIEDPERADEPRVFVGKEREVEAPHPIAEMSEYLGAVIADCGYAEALRAELLERSFQLHELGLAIGSPIGRAVEVEESAFRTLEHPEVPKLSVRIRDAEVRDSRPDLDSGSEIGVEGVIGIERLLCE